MATTATRIVTRQAQVLESRPITTKFGDKFLIKLLTTNGDEIKIWTKEEKLPRRPRVEEFLNVRIKPNGAHEIIWDDATTASTATPPEGTPSEKKRKIKAFIDEQAKVIAYCHSQVSSALPGVSDEVIQKYATTLYLELNRKI